MGEKTGSADFFAGFLVGALVGAAAALLFAPQSGEETRTMIRDKGIELGERADALSVEARKRAEELQAQAKERAEALSTQAKERAQDVQVKVKQAVEEGKAAATKKKEDLLTQLEPDQAADATPTEV
jgi:gas vesicle protein